MKGELIWQKTLSATDAQEQQGHPTGDLRLTQAGFHVGTELIDPTTYFRGDIFGAAVWAASTNVNNKLVETAEVEFDVTILGNHLGRMVLTVSHKPSGEADQGNYTTNIRWGSIVSGANLTGRELRLYAPAVSGVGPFVLEVS